MSQAELELLLSLDGASFEMASNVIVEFAVRRINPSRQRPHGIVYALVLRSKSGGAPWVRFDNAHAIQSRGPGSRPVVFDHWHRTADDEGRPYEFTTALKLLDDFWREVRRALDERNIPNDL